MRSSWSWMPSLEILREELGGPARHETHQLILGSPVPGKRARRRRTGGDLAPQVLSRVGEYGDLDANAEARVRIVELLDAHGQIEALELALVDHLSGGLIRLGG